MVVLASPDEVGSHLAYKVSENRRVGRSCGHSANTLRSLYRHVSFESPEGYASSLDTVCNRHVTSATDIPSVI